MPVFFARYEKMNEHDLPPPLRESNQPHRPELQIPLEAPELLDVPSPVPDPEEKDDRPVDPFLRRS
jgi:hypothetical protein